MAGAGDSPLSTDPLEIPEGTPTDERGMTRQDYEAIRRSRVKHAIGLLTQNGVKPFFLVSVEEVMALDDRLDGRLAAAALDLAVMEFDRPDYSEFFADAIAKTLEKASEDPDSA